MATYIMSDLHGAFDELNEMLELIQFSQEDTLYILGDVVDRGDNGIEILQKVMKTPNIKMILGNHEYMLLQFFEPDADEKIKRRWNRNGNFTTLNGLDKVTPEEKKDILDFIRSMPSEIRINVNGTDYILVHGFLGETTHDRVWNRPKIDVKPDLKENERIIIGHTPVCEYVCPGSDEDIYVYSRELTNRGDHFRILYTEGFIDIDCCVGYGLSAARLACLRLEDNKEFYVKVKK